VRDGLSVTNLGYGVDAGFVERGLEVYPLLFH
jgi:hypothetical protein